MCKEKRKRTPLYTLLVKVSLSFYYHLISKLNLNDYSTWEKLHKWSSSSMTGFFPENEKFACSIFLWAAGIYKKTTDTLTYKHYNIIGFVIKKRVKNWKQKLKQREKKSSSRKKQSFWYYVLHHYYVSCQSLKKTSNFVKPTNRI